MNNAPSVYRQGYAGVAIATASPLVSSPGTVLAPATADLPHETINGVQLRFGSGVPDPIQGNPGDYYFRGDTPAVANQRLYVKTTSTTWIGIV